MRRAALLGVRVAGEIYPDLSYTPEGRIIIEREKAYTDVSYAAHQTRLFLSRGVVEAVDGSHVALRRRVGLHPRRRAQRRRGGGGGPRGDPPPGGASPPSRRRMSAAPLRRVLVANRGEIAVRVIRACRDLGIEAVAVYSDADADALHVELADEAVAIGPAPARKSYLRVEAIVEAALTAGADAVSSGATGSCPRCRLCPGRARRPGCGSWDRRRTSWRWSATRSGRGRPRGRRACRIVPGSGRIADVVAAQAFAEEVGYPVLLKASAGGGGRGIREVAAPDDMRRRSRARRGGGGGVRRRRSVRGEAIERPRHVEVQILGRRHGYVVHLFERECSIQRRHQKLVEESPSPASTTQLRAGCARRAVRWPARSATGTPAPSSSSSTRTATFYFLEVNARIQVEHAVTELVTGVDWSANRCASRPASRSRSSRTTSRCDGHAIEFRINAEDPANGFHAVAGPDRDLRAAGRARRAGGRAVEAGSGCSRSTTRWSPRC